MFGKTLPRAEKLKAAGAFSAIALSSAAAFYLMLFSGFQFDPPASRTTATAEPSERYFEMMEGGWRSAYVARTTPRASADAEGFEESTPADQLAGDARPSPEGYRDGLYQAPSEEDLYREIDALYAEQERRAAAGAESEPDEFSDDKTAAAPEANPEPVSVYGSESPW